MEHLFVEKLDNNLKEQIRIYLECQSAAIEQYPGWYECTGNSHHLTYYIGLINKSIVCFTTIVEPKTKIALIEYGPVFVNYEDALTSILEIKNYYKKKKFIAIKIQLFVPAGTESEYIDQKLILHTQIKHFADKDENWASLQLDLSIPEDELFKNFSKGHKSAIKKAYKNGLAVKEIFDSKSIQEFVQIFIRMYKARGFSVNQECIQTAFSNMFTFIHEKKMGSILSVYNQDGKMVGAIFLIKQGRMVRYYKGAADPDFRNLPILHCALFEGIKQAKKWGASAFDFWGYCLLADEADQRYNLNIFKKGFGGKLIIYPKTMYIPIIRSLFFVYKNIYSQFKPMIRRVISIFRLNAK